MPDKASRRAGKKATRAASSHSMLVRAEAEKADQFIADRLKALYDAVVVEPVPDRLMQLLDRLDDDAQQ